MTSNAAKAGQAEQQPVGWLAEGAIAYIIMGGAMSDHTNDWACSCDGRWSRVEGWLLLEAGQRSEAICWARISVLGDHGSLLRRRSITGDVEAAKTWADETATDYASG